MDVTFLQRSLTRACGFPVLETLQGTINVKLFTAANGSVREVDTYPDLTITFSSPTTGGSFSHHLDPAITECPDGVYVGAPAVVTGLGLHGKEPGLPANAGKQIFDGVVLFIEPSGVPIVAFGPPVEVVGHQNDPAEFIGAACAALAG